MTDAPSLKFLSQAEFARHRKVSRNAVTVWKSKGLLVLNVDGLIDVDATEWKLDDRPATYRGGVTHRPVRAADGNNFEPKASKLKPPTSKSGASRLPSEPVPDNQEIVEPAFDPTDENLTHAEAVRRKENYLGLLRKRELEISNQEWMRVEDVGKAVEREYSVVRERLLAIPGKLAAKLVDRDRAAIELALFEEISEALSELHDPNRVVDRDADRRSAEEGEVRP